MFICICRLVTRSEIESLITAGAHSIEQVGEASSAGTDCGKCRRNIERLLQAYERAVESTQRDSPPH
jgi:bacterioferritin-associated ferredoxin